MQKEKIESINVGGTKLVIDGRDSKPGVTCCVFLVFTGWTELGTGRGCMGESLGQCLLSRPCMEWLSVSGDSESSEYRGGGSEKLLKTPYAF